MFGFVKRLQIGGGLWGAVLFLSSLQSLQASHLMGGEITWKCLGNGQYVFRLRLYRDCNGIPMPLPVALRAFNVPGVTQIPMSLVAMTEISPQCDGAGPTISCANTGPNIFPPTPGAAQQYEFESNPITLPGVPPPQGWIFTFDDCCRNNAILNLVNPGIVGMTLRSIMYPVPGQQPGQCADNSPVFEQRPAIIICAGTPFYYNHNASDVELDSLYYDFATSLDWMNGGSFSSAVPLTYAPGYSYTSPMPSQAQNPNNQPMQLNHFTGEFFFHSYTYGNFVSVIKVEAYRCGIKVAEIFREIQVVILNCGANNPPQVTAPFQNAQGQYTLFTDTVMVGDTVDFVITAHDPEFLPTGWPQQIWLSASGGMFGLNFSDPDTGCPYPPCAILSPAPPAASTTTMQLHFIWPTTCDHIAYPWNCYSLRNLHTFVITFSDNYCPAPSYRTITVAIVVVAKPIVPSPELRCLEVHPNGDVTLTWIPSTDPHNTFQSYRIYAATHPNGPYTEVDSIFDINQNTYTHVGAGAHLQSIYYYVITRSGCYGKIADKARDTLQTIFVSATAPNPPNIEVSWNAISTPLIPSNSGQYTLYGATPPGMLSSLYQGSALNYTDYFPTCQVTRQYQVVNPDASGCLNVSNVFQDTFLNLVAPQSIPLDSVSASAGGIAAGWSPSAEPDVGNYILFYVAGSQYIPIAQVNAAGATFFEDAQHFAQDGPHSYALAVVDTCGNVSDTSAVHTTIHLTHQIFPCLGQNILSWTPYGGWPPTAYRVWTSLNGGPYTLLASLSGNTLTYTHQNLQQGQQYCYRIQALGPNGQSSTSNTLCVSADVQNLPAFSYIRFATVQTDKSVYLCAVYDTLADVKKIYLTRARASTGIFDTIATLYRDVGSPQVCYLDQQVLTDFESYLYRLVLIDNCNQPSGQSNIARTILLRGQQAGQFANSLFWNDYEGWPQGPESYTLERLVPGIFTSQALVGQFPSNPGFVQEDVYSLLPEEALFEQCYRVLAREAVGNPLFFKDSSYSNIICIPHEPTFFVPNAINPSGGINTIFQPEGLWSHMVESYHLMIFNRWGELLFETRDINNGWDGTYQGKPCPVGVYVYKMELRFRGQEEQVRFGTVTIVR
ncbi:MAG: gliding motility-associated C-terminal domain-containing protein [Flavobacteriales bacterium]|nr:gliding motility-associated C-terminal domain-containing protein [Flavobacteriales bacterium]MDW8410538.1 gliding motility-associated C-terminal domain-containing protein [Flavobacteriales bacterium]